VFNNSVVNAIKAVKERVLFVKQEDGTFERPIQPHEDVFSTRTKHFRYLLKRYSTYTAPMDSDKFVESYAGSRQYRIYKQALEENRSQGGVERQHAHTRDFIKAEKTTKPRPRLIRPGHARYNVSIGPYIKTLEHKIYATFEKVFKYDVIAKGKNSYSRGEMIAGAFNHFTKPKVLSIDAKQFDQHVSRVALETEFSIYQIFNNDPIFMTWMSWQLKNTGTVLCSDGMVKYEIEGTRTSGVMNTALGNIVIMCTLIYSYFHSIGMSTHEYRLVNDGDDFVLIVESHDKRVKSLNMKEWFLEMGFRLEIEDPVYEMEHIDFCQSRPVYDGNKWIMVRTPKEGIAKDSICLRYLDTGKQYKGHIAAVSKGGLAANGGVPVWDAFYRRLLKESGGVEARPDQDTLYKMKTIQKNMNRNDLKITPEIRVSFYKAFGISPTRQEDIENAMRTALIDTTLRDESLIEILERPVYRVQEVWT